MKKRKFAEGGEAMKGGALEELAEGKAKGSFDEGDYKRARAFLEKGGKQEEAAEEARTVRSVRPKVTDTGDETARMARRAPTAAPAAMGRAEIPVGPHPMGRAGIPVDPAARGPAPEGRIPGELERNIRNTAAALTPGIGRAASAVAAPLAASAARGYQAGRPAAALARSTPRVGDEGLEALARSMANRPVAAQRATSGAKYTPKQEMEAAESTMRGATSRKAVQESRAKRLGRDRLKQSIEDAQKGYAKGGSVRGDGICQRGKTKGRFV